MKRIGWLFVFCVFLYLLQGCGHGNFNEAALSEIDLPAGTAVMVNSGDRLLPTMDNTRIRVTHIYEDGTRSVEVLTGSAKLIKGNYGLASI